MAEAETATAAEVRELTDNELRDRLTGYGHDDLYRSELHRRIPALGTLHSALVAAMRADQADHRSWSGHSPYERDVPDSLGTGAVRALYEAAVVSWLDGAQDLVTKHTAAEILGMTNADSAARKLGRWDVHPVGYTGGPRPEALYPRAAVEEEAARVRRPGRRAREGLAVVDAASGNWELVIMNRGRTTALTNQPVPVTWASTTTMPANHIDGYLPEGWRVEGESWPDPNARAVLVRVVRDA